MTIKLTILGCGGSAGVPMIGNRWGKCDPNEPKNRRLRCSALLQSAETAIIIDTGSDFREQLNAVQIHHLDAVLYTHFHGDHINGFEELRYLYKRGNPLIPLYAEPQTQDRIRAKFPHMFITDDPTGFYPLPIEFKGWTEADYTHSHTIGDITVQPFKMLHSDIVAVGYRVGDVAYCTDIHQMPDDSIAQLQGLKTLIIDCNNIYDENPNGLKIHMDFAAVQRLNEKLRCPDVILTHLKNNCDYREITGKLPKGYRLAYDGMEIDIN